MTAFSTDHTRRKLTVTHLGPCNAPATLEWLIATVLGGLTYESYLVYLDDVNVIAARFKSTCSSYEKCPVPLGPPEAQSIKVPIFFRRKYGTWVILCRQKE
jgi:hypothetical protein